MAKELDDLTAAIAKLTSAVEAIKSAPVPVTPDPGIDPVAVEAAAVEINALADKLAS